MPISILAVATKLNRKATITLLGTSELTDSVSRNILIGSVKQMFERGAIRTQAAASTLVRLIQENKMDQVDAKIGKLEKVANTKAAKRPAGEMAQDANYTTHERETSKHIIKIKNKNSELPTFELKFKKIHIKKIHTTFEATWKDGVARLVKIAADKIKEKRNLKIVVGVECLIVEPLEDEETENDTCTYHARVSV